MADDMFTVSLKGQRELILKMEALPHDVRTALLQETYILALMLENTVKVEHLSGPTGDHTLSVGETTSTHTGGQLRASVFNVVTDEADGVRGKVAFASDVVYAAIHEFGGTIDIPEIRPVKAKALHWIGTGGEDVFRAVARAHTVTMPERAPLRTSLKERKQDIIDGYRNALMKAIQ